MARTGVTATLEDVNRIAQQIVERFHPQKVILFGSYAYGRPTVDSDIDLLILMDTQQSAAHLAGLISASIDHPYPLDILVFPARDWEELLRERAVFPTQVAAKGKVLYEARHA